MSPLSHSSAFQKSKVTCTNGRTSGGRDDDDDCDYDYDYEYGYEFDDGAVVCVPAPHLLTSCTSTSIHVGSRGKTGVNKSGISRTTCATCRYLGW